MSLISEAFATNLLQPQPQPRPQLEPEWDLVPCEPSAIVHALKNYLETSEESILVKQILSIFLPFEDKLMRAVRTNIDDSDVDNSDVIRTYPNVDNSDVLRHFRQMCRDRSTEARSTEARSTEADTTQEEVTVDQPQYDPQFVKKVLHFYEDLEQLSTLEETIDRSRKIAISLNEFIREKDDEIKMLHQLKESFGVMNTLLGSSTGRKSSIGGKIESDMANIKNLIKNLETCDMFTKKLSTDIAGKVSSVSEEITCSVCLDIQTIRSLSVNQNCGHIICTSCSTRVENCPQCRAEKSYTKIFS